MPKKSKEYIALNNLDLIREMRAGGATETQIRTALHLSGTAWNNYKNKFPIIQETIDDANIEFCRDLKRKLYEASQPHYLITEKKIYKTDEKGQEYLAGREVTKKQVDGSVLGLALLLKNNDPDFCDNPQKQQNENKITDLRLETEKNRQWNN